MTISDPLTRNQVTKAHAVLSFRGERLEPNDILPLISLTAKRVRRKGELVTKQPPLPGEKIPRAPFGSFYYSTHPVLPSPDINEHVAFCFATLRTHWAEIAALREAQGFRIKIACFFSNDREKALWLLSEENERLSREFGIEVENETNFDLIPRRRR